MTPITFLLVGLKIFGFLDVPMWVCFTPTMLDAIVTFVSIKSVIKSWSMLK